MNQPYWYYLLYYWGYVKKPEGSGLTIPFLIGAELELDGNRDLSIERLLTEFSEMASTKVISLRDCDHIGELICSLDEETFEKDFYPHRGNLVFVAHHLSAITDHSQRVAYLQGKYGELIWKQNYSKNNGSWTGFTASDKLVLAGAKRLMTHE